MRHSESFVRISYTVLDTILVTNMHVLAQGW